MLTYRIDESRDTILVQFSEKLTDEDIVSRFEEILANPAFNRPFRVLVDALTLEGVDVSTPTMVSLADRMRGDARFLRIAIVTENLVIIGLARMLTLLDEARELQTFATQSEAEAWIAG